MPNSLFELSVRIRMPSQYLSLNIVLSLFFILVGNISLAAEQSGTSQQQEAQQNLQAVSSAIDEIQSWLENANRRQSEEEQNLREAELEFSSLNQSLTATENSITESESEIATLNAEQMRFESEKSEQEENLRSLIRRAYLSGEQGFLKLLLNQEDLSKSARMLHYYRVFSESQVKQIEEFERPNEDHQHLDVVDEIAMLEGDDGRPKLKRG